MLIFWKTKDFALYYKIYMVFSQITWNLPFYDISSSNRSILKFHSFLNNFHGTIWFYLARDFDFHINHSLKKDKFENNAELVPIAYETMNPWTHGLQIVLNSWKNRIKSHKSNRGKMYKIFSVPVSRVWAWTYKGEMLCV